MLRLKKLHTAGGDNPTQHQAHVAEALRVQNAACREPDDPQVA